MVGSKLELLNQKIITIKLNLHMLNKDDISSEDDLFKYDMLEADLEDAQNEYRWLEFMIDEFESNDDYCEHCAR